MATVYPPNPLRIGETGEFAAQPDGPKRAIRGVEEDLWLTDIVNGVQSEVRRGDDGFTVITTNGNVSQTYVAPTWREAMIHGL